jgi:hypothetical protein
MLAHFNASTIIIAIAAMAIKLSERGHRRGKTWFADALIDSQVSAVTIAVQRGCLPQIPQM